MSSSPLFCLHCGYANVVGVTHCSYCRRWLTSGPSLSMWQKISRRKALWKIIVGTVALPAAAGSVYVTGKRLLHSRPYFIYSGRLLVSSEQTGVKDVVWLPDGASVAAIGSSDTNVHVLNVVAGKSLSQEKLLAIMDRRSPLGIGWSSNGEYLLTLMDGENGIPDTVQMWDVITEQIVRSVPMKQSTMGWEDQNESLNGNPWAWNGQYLAVSAGQQQMARDTVIEIWDIFTGNNIITLKLDDQYGSVRVMKMVWAPHSGKLAVLTDQSWEMWDVLAEKKIWTIWLDNYQILGICAWSPDEKSIALGTMIFDVETGRIITGYMLEDELLLSQAWSPNGARLAVASIADTYAHTFTVTIYIVDASSGRQVAMYDEGEIDQKTIHAIKMVWSPDGNDLLVVNSGNIEVWKDIG